MPVTVDHPFDYSKDEDVLALKEENKKLQKEILMLELQKENQRLKAYKDRLTQEIGQTQLATLATPLNGVNGEITWYNKV